MNFHSIQKRREKYNEEEREQLRGIPDRHQLSHPRFSQEHVPDALTPNDSLLTGTIQSCSRSVKIYNQDVSTSQMASSPYENKNVDFIKRDNSTGESQMQSKLSSKPQVKNQKLIFSGLKSCDKDPSMLFKEDYNRIVDQNKFSYNLNDVSESVNNQGPQQLKQIKQQNTVSLWLKNQNQKKKTEEPRWMKNWKRLKKLYFENKQKQCISLEQYKLINDWASSEYSTIEKEGRKNKLKRNSLISSFDYAKHMLKEMERSLFPSLVSSIPVFLPDSISVLLLEIILLILFSISYLDNWVKVFFSQDISQTTNLSPIFQFTLILGAFIDIFRNVNKAYTLNGEVISDRRILFKNYKDCMLVFDIVFAISQILIHLTTSSTFFLVILILHLLPLLKIFSIYSIHSQLKFRLNVRPTPNEFNNFLELLIIFFIFIHLTATAYFVIILQSIIPLNYNQIKFQARIFQWAQMSEQTWIECSGLNKSDYWTFYLESMRRSASLMMGGMSSAPECSTNFERTFEIVGLVIGLFLMNLFIHKKIKSEQVSSSNYQEHRGLIHYLSSEGVPDILRLRISSYLRAYEKEERQVVRSVSTEQSLNKLSEGLSSQLRCHTNGEYLKSLLFFNKFSQELRTALVEVMEERVFQPGQVIFEDAEIDKLDVFLIKRGRVELCYDTRRRDKTISVVRQLNPGNYFGEISFLTGFPRKCGAISRDISSVVCIPREQFFKILKTSRHTRDYEIFCELRDRFLFGNEQTILDILCFSCGSTTHMSDQCLKTHGYIHRKAILHKLSANYTQRCRHKFKRFRDLKEQAISQGGAAKMRMIGFLEQNEETINFLQEDIQMKRFLYTQNSTHNQMKHLSREDSSQENILPMNNSDDCSDTQSDDDDDDDDQDSSITEEEKEDEKSSSDNSGEKQNQKSQDLNSKRSAVLTSSQSVLKKTILNNNAKKKDSASMTSFLPGSNLSSVAATIQSNNRDSCSSHHPINNGSYLNNHVEQNQQEELGDYLSINNEHTIGSIFHNVEKKPSVKDIRQVNRDKQNSLQSNYSSATQSCRSQTKQAIGALAAGSNSPVPKISVSCSDLDSNPQMSISNLQTVNQGNKKSNIRHSFTFNTAGLPAEGRKSFQAQREPDSSSSNESNAQDFLFDPQLAPLSVYSPSQAAFDQVGGNNIFIIEGHISPKSHSEEKIPKRSKFDLLQEKMNNDSDSTPLSLLESVYNVDSHPNVSHKHVKRQGILPHSTSLSENVRKIAKLYSQASTNISGGIGQVLNLQMLNQHTHRLNYSDPNEISCLPNFEKSKSYNKYFPLFNLENVLSCIQQMNK